MAIYVTTPDPKVLWDSFCTAINEGVIETWKFHKDSVHFTHTATQWEQRAYFKAVVHQGMLAFNIVKPKASLITIDVYAEYHALLLRVLLAHFDRYFSNAAVTALAVSGDIISV